MADTLKLEIVTPEAVTFSEDVDMVTLPGVEGELGIFPQHVPLMTQVVPGEISVRKAGQEIFLAVGEGFVEILPDRVSVLCKAAETPDEIDIPRAEASRTRAEKRLSESKGGADDGFARAEVRLRRALNRISVARRRSGL